MAPTRTKETTTIRIRRDTLARLKELAVRDEVALTAMLDQVVDRYWRDDFHRRAHEAFSELRADPEAWSEYVREREEWDVTLQDGLKDYPWCQE
jgi:hypothetical protein